MINLEHHVEALQTDVIAAMTRQSPPPDARVQIEWRGDTPFAVTIPAALEVNLSDRLTIPPL